MHRDIDTALLRALVAVVETGSVTGAAALLNLTQAAVSQQLKRLEELFGTELFERQHKRLALRPNGERLLTYAHRLIALNDETWGAMSAPAYQGEVRLGVPHDIVGPYLPPILRRFDKAWPRVRVSLECTTTPRLLALLHKGDIDLTLTTEQSCGASGEILLEDELVWAGAINGAAHRRDPLPLSLGDEKCAFRAVVLKVLRDAGRDWRPVCEVSSMEPLLASIEADLAIAPLLRTTIPKSFAGGRARGPAAAAAEVLHQHVPAAGAPERDRRRACPPHPPGIRSPRASPGPACRSRPPAPERQWRGDIGGLMLDRARS